MLETIWIVFVILKLCGLINWSWWAVNSPVLIFLGYIFLLWLSSIENPIDKWFKDNDYSDFWKR